MDLDNLPPNITVVDLPRSLYKNVIYNCSRHGEITQLKRYFLKSSNCPKCLGRNWTRDEYIADFNITHNSKYNYDKVEINKDTKHIIIICRSHGEFTQSKHAHKSGHGCPKCKGKQLTIQEKKSKILNPNVATSETPRTNKDKITASCSIHGEFRTSMHSLVSTQACPKCSNKQIGESRVSRRSVQDLIDAMNDVHNTKYTYDISTYCGVHKKIPITCEKHGTFTQMIYSHLGGVGCPACAKKYDGFENYARSNYDCVINDRTLIKPLEIDAVFENFGIEYNGVYWHSGNSKDTEKPNYHLNKTELCEAKGIQLFHIFDNEWIENRSIWESVINSKLGKTERIYARKTEVKYIDDIIYSEFCSSNHLQGSVNASVKIGLFYQGELVSVMSFSKSRFNKSIQYELIRFCSKLNTTVVGGASKLLKFFERVYNPESIISYANRRWSTGNLYQKLGFEFTHNTKPNYFYFKGNSGLLSRQKFQKHKLKDKLEHFDSELTETENMYNNGYRKIYDSGNKTYIKRY